MASDDQEKPPELAELQKRVDQLEAQTRRARRERHPARSVLAVVLVLVAALLTPLSLVATWANSIVGDTDRYVATVAPLASDPDVQDAVTNRVTTAVMDHIDIHSLLDKVAPADRPRLDQALNLVSGPLTSGISGLVQDTVHKFVTSDTFDTLWVQLNRRAHTAVDKALTGKGGGAVKLTGDAVTIDLAPVIDEVKKRLVDRGLTIAGKIPEVHTSFTVLRSDELRKVKQGFRLLQLLGVWLPLLTLVIAAAGVLLAVRRRRALVTVALLVAAGAAVLGIALWVFRPFYLDALPADVSQPAAGSVYDALVHFLRASVRMVITLGVAVALAAWLTGEGRAARRVKAGWTGGIGAVREATGLPAGRVDAWVHRAKPWLNWTVVAVAAAVVLAWNYPTSVVIVWIVVCALIALAVIEFLDSDESPHLPASP
ncbi:hypothetical protein ACWCP6_23570 [Streptomyces sp. NPDC002004]